MRSTLTKDSRFQSYKAGQVSCALRRLRQAIEHGPVQQGSPILREGRADRLDVLQLAHDARVVGARRPTIEKLLTAYEL